VRRLQLIVELMTKQTSRTADAKDLVTSY